MMKALKNHWSALLLFAAGTFIYASAQMGESLFERHLVFGSEFHSEENLSLISARLSRLGYPVSNENNLASVLALIDEASQKYQLERELLLSVALVESGLNPKSLSEKGAVGIFQILPQTAAWLKEDFLNSLSANDPLRLQASRVSLSDPRTSTLMGAFYISKLKVQFNQQLHLALAAYNVGPGTLRRAMSQGDLKGTEYIFRVYQIRNALKGV